jgi:hypothetical protein
MIVNISFGTVLDDPRKVVMMMDDRVVWTKRFWTRRKAQEALNDWHQVSLITGAALGSEMLYTDRELRYVEVDSCDLE